MSTIQTIKAKDIKVGDRVLIRGCGCLIVDRAEIQYGSSFFKGNLINGGGWVSSFGDPNNLERVEVLGGTT